MSHPLRALFLVPYPIDCGPGQRFRFEQWLSLLPPGSVDAEVRPFFDRWAYNRLYEAGGTARKAAQSAMGIARRMRDLVGTSRWDVAFIYRGAVPVGPPVIEELLSRRVPFVFDFDDAIFLGDTSPANRLAAQWKRPDKTGEIVARAAETIVGNHWLGSYARRFSSRVSVVPTTVDVERFRPGPRPAGGAVRLGWSGSRTTSQHLHTIDSALGRILSELPAELVVLGDPAYRVEHSTWSSASSQGGGRVSALPWRRETEISDLRTFDIGMMPLPDDDWSKGKCGLKALLYMALGIASVSSPVGVNTEIVTHGENGLLASTEDEWVEAVRLLTHDSHLRGALGEAGRQTVVDHYSGQRWAPRFLEILEGAASTRP